MLLVVFLLFALNLWGCAGSAPLPTSDLTTPTPHTTSDSGHSLKPGESVEPIQPTSTIAPSPTTQSGFPSPTAGSPGSAAGTVYWNSKPVAGVTILLCLVSTASACKDPTMSVVSDENGQYTITNVPPGNYLVSTQLAGQSGETLWKNDSFSVTTGQQAAVNDLHVYRFDAQISLPENYAVITNVTPTLAWNAYPEGSYYKLYLVHDHAHVFIDYLIINATTYTFTEPQQTGDYDWLVEVYNNRDIKIAVSPNSYFSIEP
jgi:hypothetical protein